VSCANLPIALVAGKRTFNRSLTTPRYFGPCRAITFKLGGFRARLSYTGGPSTALYRGLGWGFMTDDMSEDNADGEVSSAETEEFDRDRMYRLAEQKTRTGRRDLAETIADLFYAGPSALSERERTLIFDILRRVISDAELAVRRKLSAQLAEFDDAPSDLVVALANDEIEVAYPILTRSRALEDEQLIEVVQTRAQEHQLAVALRENIPGTVSDALVATNNGKVVTTLLQNATAEISRATLEYLVEQSRRIDAYQEPILRREDLPVDLAKRMYRWVSDALRQYIVENFEIDENELSRLLDDAIEEETGRTEAQQRSDAASRLIAILSEGGQATPGLLLDALEEGEVRLFIGILRQRTGLREVMLMRMLMEPEGEGLAIICKASEFERADVERVFEITSGRLGLIRRSQEDIDDAIRLFSRVPIEVADEVIQHWKRSSDYRSALRMLGL
jgi:uncharacterized protein (DUF2336 family)